MALRDQPYIPLYVQDFLTDEKLNECSPATTGVYIKIICVMHKSKEYGKVLLKQKDKQKESKCSNFACKLANHMNFKEHEIEPALNELIQEEVLHVDGDYLIQKRMVKDNDISLKRSEAGKKGGGNPSFVKTKTQTNVQTNSEYENEYEVENENDNKDIYVNVITYFNERVGTKYRWQSKTTQSHINARLAEGFVEQDFYTCIDNKCDDWLNNSEMIKFLRPETLFCKKHFESYVNEQKTIGQRYGVSDNAAQMAKALAPEPGVMKQYGIKPVEKGQIIDVE